MKKPLLSLAVLGAVASPLVLADSNVTIYGNMDVGVESFDNGLIRKTQVQDYFSYIGFKGEEKIDGGLSAIFQIETRVAPDDSAGSAAFASRNSFVGLKGGFGTVLLGTYDTPWKTTTNGTNVIDGPGEQIEAIINQDQSTTGLNYHTRQTNTVQYWSPNFSGFDFKLGFGPDEAKDKSKNATRWSMNGGYSAGPLYVGLGYEMRADNLSFVQTDKTTTFRDSNAVKLVGRYTFAGATTLGFAYSHLNQDMYAAPDLSRNAWSLSVKHLLNEKVALSAAYAYASKDKARKAVNGAIVDKDNGAKEVSLEAAYLFSKRTKTYAFYSQMRNDSDGNYGFKGSQSATTDVPGALGKKLSVLGVAVQHKF